jgi:hypothetical protein
MKAQKKWLRRSEGCYKSMCDSRFYLRLLSKTSVNVLTCWINEIKNE